MFFSYIYTKTLHVTKKELFMSKLSLKGPALQTFSGMDTKKSNFFRGNEHKNIFRSFCLIKKDIHQTVSEFLSSSFFITTRPHKLNTNLLFSFNSLFIYKLKAIQAIILKDDSSGSLHQRLSVFHKSQSGFSFSFFSDISAVCLQESCVSNSLPARS